MWQILLRRGTRCMAITSWGLESKRQRQEFHYWVNSSWEMTQLRARFWGTQKVCGYCIWRSRLVGCWICLKASLWATYTRTYLVDSETGRRPLLNWPLQMIQPCVYQVLESVTKDSLKRRQVYGGARGQWLEAFGRLIQRRLLVLMKWRKVVKPG